MPVICCAWCGTPFPGRNNAKYCNQDCYRRARAENAGKQARNKQTGIYLNGCEYNEGVNCFPQGDCRTCGWNPEVAEKRLVRILAHTFGMEVKMDGE